MAWYRSYPAGQCVTLQYDRVTKDVLGCCLWTLFLIVHTCSSSARVFNTSVASLSLVDFSPAVSQASNMSSPGDDTTVTKWKPFNELNGDYTNEFTEINTHQEQTHSARDGISQTEAPRLSSAVSSEARITGATQADQLLDDKRDIFSDEVTDLPKFHLPIDDCWEGKTVNISGTRGEVLGFTEGTSTNTKKNFLICRWTISVPSDLHISADIQASTKDRIFWGVVITGPSFQVHGSPITINAGHYIAFSSSNLFHFELKIMAWPPRQALELSRAIQFKIRFQGTTQPLQNRLRVVYSSPTSGYIVPFGFDRYRYLAIRSSGTYSSTLKVPAEYVVMVSFRYLFWSALVICTGNQLKLWQAEDNGRMKLIFKKCLYDSVQTSVYNTSLILQNEYRNCWYCVGFKMLFSLHLKVDAPLKLADGLFNCSVPRYPSFKQHLHCNLEMECHGGEDEGHHCPFSPPGCNGLVGYKDKCYKPILSPKPVFQKTAERKCLLLPRDSSIMEGEGDWNIAMMKTEGEWEAFKDIFRHGKLVLPTLVGLSTADKALPGYYTTKLMWTDGTLQMDKNQISVGLYSPHFLDGHKKVVVGLLPSLKISLATGEASNLIVCEFTRHKENTANNSVVVFPQRAVSSNSIMNVTQSLIRCGPGHVTHAFLACDPLSDCGVDTYVSSCRLLDESGEETQDTRVSTDPGKAARPASVAMFVCDDGKSTLHFTLVCDFRRDCADGSDEESCVHEVCPDSMHTCSSGQCVGRDKKCDFVKDCVDGSDEWLRSMDCYGMSIGIEWPVQYSYLLYNSTAKLNSTSSPCPDTHFTCPGEFDFCLPVYVRCNGVYDCPGKEDEADCTDFQCPGLYRCRDSKVCVLMDDLCDGWAHCPQHDDEILCNVTCPENCRCQGLAFICDSPVFAHMYPNLRYLDGSYSGMGPEDFTENPFLAWLSLAHCNLTTLPGVTLKNLRTLKLHHNLIQSIDALRNIILNNLRTIDLSYNCIEGLGQPVEIAMKNLRSIDLSHNCIKSASMDFFTAFPSMRVLSLAHNPLVTLTRSWSNGNADLERIDLSSTLIKTLDANLFSTYPRLTFINMSFTQIQTLAAQAFQNLTEFSELDLRGVRLKNIPNDLFQGLDNLQVVRSENYELCCSNMLPEDFDTRFCFAPEDAISSCQQLLKSDTHRLYLWTSSVLSIVGNAGCVVMLVSSQVLHVQLTVKVLLVNLKVAHVLMGIYLMHVVAADEHLAQRYMQQINTWPATVACRVAGLVWLISRLVSASMMSLMTLERLSTLRYSQYTFHFRTHIAVGACITTWMVALLLALIPLLPMTSHWQFYGQSAVCLPGFVDGSVTGGHDYFAGMMTVFNIVLCMVIGVGQYFISRSIRLEPATLDVTERSAEVALARCLLPIGTLDFLCWFPFGVLTVIIGAGRSVAADYHVLTAMYLLPLHSSLSPLLYAFTIVSEKRRQKEKARLLVLLKSRVTSKKEASRSTSKPRYQK